MKIKNILPILLLFVLTNCQSQKNNEKLAATQEISNTGSLASDGTLTVKIGEAKTLKNENFTVKFIKVLEDSRCPKGMECIWAGRASIEIEVSNKNTPAQTMNLSTTTGLNNAVIFNGYQISLLNLTPQNELGKKLNPADYTILLKIEKPKANLSTATTNQ